ncbi:MAG: hypothetical protein AB9834_02185 [Lentimicrobium sp.]
MKARMKLLLSAFVATTLIFSCNHENETNQPSEVIGQLVSQSGCKYYKSDAGISKVSDSLSCVEYTYEAAHNKLLLKHINAGFNCCPGNLSCDLTISNDTIFVQESEQHALCNCDCLYDLNIEVTGIENRLYQLQFIEPYIGDQEPLNFSIDLQDAATGSYCVSRIYYPWGF